MWRIFVTLKRLVLLAALVAGLATALPSNPVAAMSGPAIEAYWNVGGDLRVDVYGVGFTPEDTVVIKVWANRGDAYPERTDYITTATSTGKIVFRTPDIYCPAGNIRVMAIDVQADLASEVVVPAYCPH